MDGRFDLTPILPITKNVRILLFLRVPLPDAKFKQLTVVKPDYFTVF